MLARTRHASYCQSEDGAVLPLVAVSLAVFLGLVALSFDLGRTAATQSELQSFADHVALAAAGELDGNAGAIERAQIAAAELIEGRSGGWPAFRQTFGIGDRDLTVRDDYSDYTLSFYRTLPNLDTQAVTPQTPSDADARYVRATATPRTITYTFARAFNALTGRAGPNQAQISASAVAGFTRIVCDVTPLMFCLPQNPIDPGLPFRAEEHIGKMILLRAGGNNAAWGPGDFGFVDVTSIPRDSRGNCVNNSGNLLTGAQLRRCLMAAQEGITACYVSDGIDLSPGQQEGISSDAFNTRFGLYPPPLNQSFYRNNPAFGPAPITISQVRDNECTSNNPGQTTNTRNLPRDDCFVEGTCARFGDGDFSEGLEEYLAWNYGEPAGTPLVAPPEWFPPGSPTRYDIYREEIRRLSGEDAYLGGRDESGNRLCGAARNPHPERRILIAAGIDCTAYPINGAATNVPVGEFFRLFMTEPVETTPSNNNMYLEIVGSASEQGSDNNSAGVIRDVVQLYR